MDDRVRLGPSFKIAMRISAVLGLPVEEIFTPDPEDLALVTTESADGEFICSAVAADDDGEGSA